MLLLLRMRRDLESPVDSGVDNFYHISTEAVIALLLGGDGVCSRLNYADCM